MAAYPVTNGEWMRFVARRRSGTALLARARRRVVSAPALRRDSTAAVVARLRYPSTGSGLRALDAGCDCRPKPSTTAPLSVRRPATSVRFRGAPIRRLRVTGTSDSSDSIPSRSTRIRTARARGASPTSIGNGWEWTSTPFAPLPGFEPMASYPQYSADFFDGRHYVMKGASPVTPRELIRRSFRNWFYDDYPYMYAKFRCVAP